MNETTELIVLPPPESVRTVFTTPQGLEPYLQQIRAHLDTFEADVSTKKGRDAIASMAYKVAKGKTALDNLGKALVDEMKREPAMVDAERKRMRDTMDQWKEEVRAPLTAWEEAEAAREARHKAGVQWLSDQGREIGFLKLDELHAAIAAVDARVVDESWEEYEAEAHRAKARTLDALSAAIAAREREAAEQEELSKLRAEAAAREQKDREERIAREAAERAQRESEAKAQAEREATIKREADAQAAAERRELELKLQAERAEREKAEAQQREAQARADSERKAAEAVAEEQRRVAAQAAADAKEAERRERDKAHKTAVNRAALDAFVQGGMTEECAKLAVTLIAKKAIPAISISY